MIKFYLYSFEFPKGKKLAEVCDDSSANALTSYYRTVYNNKMFLVTIKRTRQKEKVITGSYEKEEGGGNKCAS